MLYRIVLPFVFVLLWSSAFVTAKVGVQYATPFAMLLARFVIIAAIFALVMFVVQARRHAGAGDPYAKMPAPATLGLTALVGVLLHVIYLGSVFFALSLGLSAGVSALIVSLQPLLASVLARHFFGERLKDVQIAGLLAGIMGVVLVLAPNISGGAPLLGIVSVTVGLVAATSGTLVQKQIGGRIDLLTSNTVQCLAAAICFTLICTTVETPRIDWQPPFIIALAWQVVAVSGGAYLILMAMIQKTSMAAVTSLLFLVPPITALMAAVGFNEPLTGLGIAGFVMTSAGVFLVKYHAGPIKT